MCFTGRCDMHDSNPWFAVFGVELPCEFGLARGERSSYDPRVRRTRGQRQSGHRSCSGKVGERRRSRTESLLGLGFRSKDILLEECGLEAPVGWAEAERRNSGTMRVQTSNSQ